MSRNLQYDFYESRCDVAEEPISFRSNMGRKQRPVHDVVHRAVLDVPKMCITNAESYRTRRWSTRATSGAYQHKMKFALIQNMHDTLQDWKTRTICRDRPALWSVSRKRHREEPTKLKRERKLPTGYSKWISPRRNAYQWMFFVRKPKWPYRATAKEDLNGIRFQNVRQFFKTLGTRARASTTKQLNRELEQLMNKRQESLPLHKPVFHPTLTLKGDLWHGQHRLNYLEAMVRSSFQHSETLTRRRLSYESRCGPTDQRRREIRTVLQNSGHLRESTTKGQTRVHEQLMNETRECLPLHRPVFQATSASRKS